ncbi:galactokinase family protein [Chryseobacterium sp. ES2]|uniref:Galactokinase family protein n=1 Tax=Chryseobacterium metallicongregator TaxID=3073042 RepID=A0ABU1E468_9FLAO|nr:MULTISPECIES: galactokinase family protein [Chryseobacterium]MDR4952594.1 galactokinase family protein [Chryseobacterium sp. ES2]
MSNNKYIDSLINEGDIPQFRELYGQNSELLHQQAVRYTKALSRFREIFGEKEVSVFSSPGRTEIGGNHTDHNHGRVLASAINLDNIAVAAKNNSNIIRIESSGYQSFEIDLDHLIPNEKEFLTSNALVRGINARLKELGYKIGGFDAVIDGCVPKGSGLSSSASFEVLIGAIVSHLFNDGNIDPILNARIGQYAENVFFGKPCGLMDQVACAVGGLVIIDFADVTNPIVKKVDFDFESTGFSLVITDTRGDHTNLNDEYAVLPKEMKDVAAHLGCSVLRETTLEKVMDIAPSIRKKVGDRAILRAIHFECENERVVDEVTALENNDFQKFLHLVIDSGHSSYMYNQNVYVSNNIHEQAVSLGLAYSELVLKGAGAWRVHGGGFAGTIQAFVPENLLEKYTTTLNHLFGVGSCHPLFIRQKGVVKLDL